MLRVLASRVVQFKVYLYQAFAKPNDLGKKECLKGTSR